MLSVRDARPDDALAIAVVHIRSWQAAYRGLLPDEYLDALRVEERAARYTFGANDQQTILAVEDDATISAFATFGASRDYDAAGAGELHALYVDPPRWDAGIGRLLMGEFETRMRAQGFPEAILWVLVGNEPAERFYRAWGYRHDGAHRHECPWGVDAEVIRYRRSLA
jgi:ribosomal protein S18 acetylase RimI-like enzyme